MSPPLILTVGRGAAAEALPCARHACYEGGMPVAETLELGSRLRAIASLVPACRVLADIGADHGYIPAALLLEGRVERAIAADIGAGPLARARSTAEKYGLADCMELRLGDGLNVLAPGEADVIVIAGMGGDAISEILAAAPWSREKGLLLLQPMSKAEVLRRWLPQNGYRVEGERLAQERGVLYPVLTVRGGDMPPADGDQAWGGFLLAGDPLWGLYLEEKLLSLRRTAAGLAKARNPAVAGRRAEILGIIEALERKKGEWELAHRT